MKSFLKQPNTAVDDAAFFNGNEVKAMYYKALSDADAIEEDMRNFERGTNGRAKCHAQLMKKRKLIKALKIRMDSLVKTN